MVRAGLTQQGTLGRVQTGWCFLHAHGFISELESFGGVLMGGGPDTYGYGWENSRDRFVVCLPVGVPPWPNRSNQQSEDIEIVMDRVNLKHVFFHDMKFGGGDEPRTAGLDGLVGVVRGVSTDFTIARSKALAIAQGMRLPEVGYRPDVGRQVPTVLAVLEAAGVSV